MDDTKKQLLKDIFWEMNSISSRTESHTETEITETDDGHGNIVQTENTVTRTYLYITVSHKTVDEMAAQMALTMSKRNIFLSLRMRTTHYAVCCSLRYLHFGRCNRRRVALQQVGNVGGAPYWSWYGFDSHVEWCAYFVSWCANECGYIDAGIIPKYAGCVNAGHTVQRPRPRMDNNDEPSPGMIIFFDWDNPMVHPVHKTGNLTTLESRESENGRLDNRGQLRRQLPEKSCPIGYYEILGYGAPAY